MKVIAAEFTVELREKTYRVRFDEKHVEITCFLTGAIYAFANDKKRWKPCATHALSLVRMVTHSPQKSPFSKRRVKITKPVLRIAE
jgi:hypothetical protein